MDGPLTIIITPSDNGEKFTLRFSWLDDVHTFRDVDALELFFQLALDAHPEAMSEAISMGRIFEDIGPHPMPPDGRLDDSREFLLHAEEQPRDFHLIASQAASVLVASLRYATAWTFMEQVATLEAIGWEAVAAACRMLMLYIPK